MHQPFQSEILGFRLTNIILKSHRIVVTLRSTLPAQCNHYFHVPPASPPVVSHPRPDSPNPAPPPSRHTKLCSLFRFGSSWLSKLRSQFYRLINSHRGTASAVCFPKRIIVRKCLFFLFSHAAFFTPKSNCLSRAKWHITKCNGHSSLSASVIIGQGVSLPS